MQIPPITININFAKLKVALLASANEYSQSEKEPNSLTNYARLLGRMIFGRFAHCPNDPARAENIRTIVQLLQPGQQLGPIAPGDVTEDQKALLLIAKSLLTSSSGKLATIASEHLIDLITDRRGNIISFGNKSFYFDVMQAHHLTHLLPFNNTPKYAAMNLLITNVNGCMLRANMRALDTLLSSPPKDSITRVPLLLLCARKFRTDTTLIALPTDIVKIIAKYVHADIKDQLIKQITEPASYFIPARQYLG